MPGGIPSGSDPTGYTAGDPTSNPAAGYDPTATGGSLVAPTATPAAVGVPGIGTGISSLASRTQAAVTTAYQNLVQSNPTLTSYSGEVFSGLDPNGSTSLPNLLLQKLAAAFGVGTPPTTTSDSLTAIEAAFTALSGTATTANDNFNTLLTDLSKADSAALAAYLTAIEGNASGAAADWTTLLAALSQADATAYAAYVAAAHTNALAAYTDWQTIFTDAGISASTSATFASWLTGVNTTASDAHTTALAAMANWETLLTSLGLSVTTATELASWLSGVNTTATTASTTAESAGTTASAALGNWTTLFTELGLSASNATTLASWLSGVSGTAGTASTTATTSLNYWVTLFGELGFSGGSATELAAWLSGAASGSMITNVSASAINSSNAQMLFNPDFSGAISIAGSGIWSWDGTVYYVPPGQTVVSPGSAMVTANGALQGLTSNPSGSFPLGQPIVFSVQVLTQALTGSGTLLELFAIPWIGTVPQTPVSIATSAAPTGATTGWTNPPTGSKATTMSGSYTPTTVSGVTSVSMQLIVTGSANSGTVRFSAASMELTGGLIADLQNESAAQSAAWATLWNSWYTTATTAGLTFTQKLSQMEAALATYQTTNTDINLAQSATISQLINALLGINTSTGQSQADVNWQTLLADVGLGSVPGLGAFLNTTSTTASNGQAWLGQWLAYARILEDIFHTTYPWGTPSDTPTTTVGGLPTYYSAWNGMLILEGLVKGTTAPTQTAPTTGAAITTAQSTATSANTAASVAQAAATTAGTNASIAISSASAANTLAQGTIDGLNHAWAAAGTTGNPVSSVPTIASAIPASAIAGNVGATVLWGATGGGCSVGPGTYQGANTGTFTHTPAPTDTSLDIILGWLGSNSGTFTTAVTYGGVAATLVANIASSANGGNVGNIQVWRIALTPTASPPSQVVSVTVSNNVGNTYLISNSVSYSGVRINYSATYSGLLSVGANALSFNVTSNSSRRIVTAIFPLTAYNPTYTAPTGTVRWNPAPANSSGLYIMDQAAASSGATTCGVTATIASGSAGPYCAIVAEMTN